MVIKMDQHSLAAHGAQMSVSVPVATDGNAERISGKTTDSIVQAEFGNQKQSATTGTYAEEVAKQLDVKEVHSDLDVMDPSDFISQCMTGEDAHDLSDEKTPLEEYTDSSLERALVRVKQQREARLDSVEASAERVREVEEDIREKSEEIASDAQLLAQVSQALANSNLPIRENSLSDLKKAFDMAGGVMSFNDASMQYMVANEDKVTPKSVTDSLYGSGVAMIGRGEVQGSDSSDKQIAVPDENADDGFDEVRTQISERLDKDGRDAKKDLDTARWLYQKDLAVTTENIEKADTVKSLLEMDDQTLLNRIVSEMEDGVLAENADLSNLSKEEVADLVDSLVNSTDADIKKAYKTPETEVTARRRLEEIRVSMTISAAREMTKLGVTIDINNLEQMVEGLREIEDRQRQALIDEAGLTDMDKIDTFMGTIDAANAVLSSPVELLSYTYERRDVITLEAMAGEGRSLAAGYTTSGTQTVQSEIYTRLEKTYEAVGTEVRSDLGDSIKKAFTHLDGLLDELNLPHTAENERALRILGYNNMEITEQSVAEIKTYDNRVNNLMESMKPQIVKRMVEEDINPLTLSLPELEEQVERIKGEVDTADIAFSKFLWKLDKQDEITDEQRQSMIGIYRLLDKIEKSDGAVVGHLVNEGRDLSLKNLLEAVRTMKRGHVDASVSDESGISEGFYKNTSIDAQIMSAFTDSEDDAEYYEEQAERLRAVLEDRDELVGIFFSETKIPATISNIMSANAFIRRQMGDVKSLWSDDQTDEVIESFDDPDELDEKYEDIEKTHKEALENLKDSDDITYDRITGLKEMAGHIAFYGALRRYQMFEVPVMTEQGIVDCNVTIKNGTKAERGTVEITVDSEELGRLQATFKLNGTKVNGFVTAERNESIEAYHSMLDNLETDLEKSGFTMDGNSLIQGNRNSLTIGDAAEGTKNKDLYRIAKCFLQSIRRG